MQETLRVDWKIRKVVLLFAELKRSMTCVRNVTLERLQRYQDSGGYLERRAQFLWEKTIASFTLKDILSIYDCCNYVPDSAEYSTGIRLLIEVCKLA